MSDDMRNVLTDARNAIASLPMETLGYASDPMGEQIHWPIRDELLHRIDKALRRAPSPPMLADIAQIIDAGRRNGKSDLEIAEDILREFDAPAQRAPWQLMDTAPKDGTPVFLIIAGSVGLPWSDYWDLEEEFWIYYHQTQEYIDRQIEPTHWMPIPALTSTECGEGK